MNLRAPLKFSKEFDSTVSIASNNIIAYDAEDKFQVTKTHGGQCSTAYRVLILQFFSYYLISSGTIIVVVAMIFEKCVLIVFFAERVNM